MCKRIAYFYLLLVFINIFCIKPVLNAPFFNTDQGSATTGDGGEGVAASAAQDYGHMAKKLMNDFFDETEFQKSQKPEEDASEEKRDFGTSEEITKEMKEDGTEEKRLESKVALFVHVLIEILKEIFEDTNVKKDLINNKIERPVQKIKITETPLTTTKPEEKIVETTLAPQGPAPTEATTTTSESPSLTETSTTISTTTVMETTVATTEILSTTSILINNLPHLSKINIPQLPTEMASESKAIEDFDIPTPTAPLISFEVPEIKKFSATVSPTKAVIITTTIPPSDTVADVKVTPPLISFEVPSIPKISQIPTKEIPEASTTTTTVSPTTTSSPASTLPPTESSTTTTTTTTLSPIPSTTPSTTPQMHYDDIDDNGIPFWLKVIDGIRCSMRDCSGVLIPTPSPYDQKELKNLTMTRFIRDHGLPPCPCLELKELQKVLSSPTKNKNNQHF